MMEGLEDYRNLAKALPRAVLVLLALRYMRYTLLWMKMRFQLQEPR